MKIFNEMGIKALILGIIMLVFAVSCKDQKQTIREETNLGIKATYSGEWKIAMDHFNYVISLDSANAEAYMYQGRMYIGMRKYDKALNSLDKSILLNPKFGEAYRSRAQVYTILGNRDASCKDYLMAEKLGVENLYNYTKFCK